MKYELVLYANDFEPGNEWVWRDILGQLNLPSDTKSFYCKVEIIRANEDE